MLHFRIPLKGQPAERLVDIGGPVNLSNLAITGVHVPVAGISVRRITPANDAQNGLLGPLGRFGVAVSTPTVRSLEIVFDTNLPDVPHIRVPVVVESQPIASPRLLFWPGLSSAMHWPVTKYVTVAHLATGSRAVLGTIIVGSGSDGSPFSVSDRVELGDATRIGVAFDAARATASFSFSVLRVTGDDGTLDLPLVGIKAAELTSEGVVPAAAK
jgi:hypothetical protein